MGISIPQYYIMMLMTMVFLIELNLEEKQGLVGLINNIDNNIKLDYSILIISYLVLIK
jgi:hypothetical protein